MITSEARAEVFWLAFQSLSKQERQMVVEKLLKDKVFLEDLIDIAIIEQRQYEPSRPLEDYLAKKAR